jgi:hypothetical protein
VDFTITNSGGSYNFRVSKGNRVKWYHTEFAGTSDCEAASSVFRKVPRK